MIAVSRNFFQRSFSSLIILAIFVGIGVYPRLGLGVCVLLTLIGMGEIWHLSHNQYNSYFARTVSIMRLKLVFTLIHMGSYIACGYLVWQDFDLMDLEITPLLTLFLAQTSIFLTLIGVAFARLCSKKFKYLEKGLSTPSLSVLSVGFYVFFAFLVISNSFPPKSPQPFLLLLITFLPLWTTDVGCYIFGKLWGSSKMSTISPNKTWEGFFLGSIFSCIVMTGLSYCILKSFSISLDWFMLVPVFWLCVSAMCQMSDIMQSYIKRSYNVKDIGKLIPGHGGVCDRFDSLLITSPLLFWAVFYLSQNAPQSPF